MELTLETLINAYPSVRILNETRGMRGVIAYRISKNIKPILKEVEEYEEQRKKLCEEYAEKDDKGEPVIKDNAYDLSKDNLKIINEQLEKIRQETVKIDVKKVTLEDIDRAELSPMQLDSIEFMLDLEEEK